MQKRTTKIFSSFQSGVMQGRCGGDRDIWSRPDPTGRLQNPNSLNYKLDTQRNITRPTIADEQARAREEFEKLFKKI